MTLWGYIGRFFAVICFLPPFMGGRWYHTVLFICLSLSFIWIDINKKKHNENA